MSQAELFRQQDIDVPQLGSLWRMRTAPPTPDPWQAVLVADLDSFGMVGFRVAGSRPGDRDAVRWLRREKFFAQYQEAPR